MSIENDQTGIIYHEVGDGRLFPCDFHARVWEGVGVEAKRNAAQTFFLNLSPYAAGKPTSDPARHTNEIHHITDVYCGGKRHILQSIVYEHCVNRPAGYQSPYNYHNIGSSLSCFMKGKALPQQAPAGDEGPGDGPLIVHPAPAGRGRGGAGRGGHAPAIRGGHAPVAHAGRGGRGGHAPAARGGVELRRSGRIREAQEHKLGSGEDSLNDEEPGEELNHSTPPIQSKTPQPPPTILATLGPNPNPTPEIRLGQSVSNRSFDVDQIISKDEMELEWKKFMEFIRTTVDTKIKTPLEEYFHSKIQSRTDVPKNPQTYKDCVQNLELSIVQWAANEKIKLFQMDGVVKSAFNDQMDQLRLNFESVWMPKFNDCFTNALDELKSLVKVGAIIKQPMRKDETSALMSKLSIYPDPECASEEQETVYAIARKKLGGLSQKNTQTALKKLGPVDDLSVYLKDAEQVITNLYTKENIDAELSKICDTFRSSCPDRTLELACDEICASEAEYWCKVLINSSVLNEKLEHVRGPLQLFLAKCYTKHIILMETYMETVFPDKSQSWLHQDLNAVRSEMDLILRLYKTNLMPLFDVLKQKLLATNVPIESIESIKKFVRQTIRSWINCIEPVIHDKTLRSDEIVTKVSQTDCVKLAAETIKTME